MTISVPVRSALLSLVAVGAALSALAVDEATWQGPDVAMADFAYAAWPIIRIALVIAAVTVALSYSRTPYSLMVLPLAGTLVLLAAVQWLHQLDLVLIDITLLIGTFALLWRAYYQVNRHRDLIDIKAQLLVVAPLGLTAGWVTISVTSAIAQGLWEFPGLREGALATAWQSALLAVALFFIGFGIEQTRAHPAYTAGALWGLAAVAVHASDAEDTTLMTVAIVVALLTVALFFIERAMFRYRARPQQPSGR